MNKVILCGHCGSDPELRFTTAGQGVLNVRMATSETYLDKDKQRQERTDWHNVVIFGKRGEALAKILAKGSQVVIEGSLRTSSYEAKDGSGKRFKTEVIASNVELCGGRGNGQSSERSGGGGRPASKATPQGDVESWDQADDGGLPF